MKQKQKATLTPSLFCCNMLNTKELMGDGSFFIHHFTLTKRVIPHQFRALFAHFRCLLMCNIGLKYPKNKKRALAIVCQGSPLYLIK